MKMVEPLLLALRSNLDERAPRSERVNPVRSVPLGATTRRSSQKRGSPGAVLLNPLSRR
jgi:hypothetical protein